MLGDDEGKDDGDDVLWGDAKTLVKLEELEEA